MTEEEARKCWCPMVRYVVNNSEASFIGNRFDGVFEEECRCIASDCMMWVWGKTEKLRHDDRSDVEIIKHGHCGLAK